MDICQLFFFLKRALSCLTPLSIESGLSLASLIRPLLNFGAEPLDGVSCVILVFVGWRDNELVFLFLSDATVRLFHSTCNSPVVHSSHPPCWHKPLFPCCTDSVLDHVWHRVPLLWRVVTCLISGVRLVVSDHKHDHVHFSSYTLAIVHVQSQCRVLYEL